MQAYKTEDGRVFWLADHTPDEWAAEVHARLVGVGVSDETANTWAHLIRTAEPVDEYRALRGAYEQTKRTVLV